MIAGVILAAACLAPPEGWPLKQFDPAACPQVWRIHGNAPVDKALNVVVLSEGFPEADLDVYRCGAGLTVEQMLAAPPFASWTGGVNVYRIDLASAQRGVPFPASCGGNPCDHEPPDWDPAQRASACAAYAAQSKWPTGAYGVPVGPANATPCLALGLEITACPKTAQECQLLWPAGEGLRKIWRLAACAPAFDAVIVVANSGTWAGGGTADLSPTLSITTLNGVSAAFTRGKLLAHEFGHALGLLDEYSQSDAFSGGRGQPPDFHPGRNVVAVGSDGSVGAVPWAAECTPPQPGVATTEACMMMCASCDGCPAGTPDPPPQVGLYAGGFYGACGYFHASAACAMNDPEAVPAGAYCAGCRVYLDGLFRDAGLEAEGGHPALGSASSGQPVEKK